MRLPHELIVGKSLILPQVSEVRHSRRRFAALSGAGDPAQKRSSGQPRAARIGTRRRNRSRREARPISARGRGGAWRREVTASGTSYLPTGLCDRAAGGRRTPCCASPRSRCAPLDQRRLERVHDHGHVVLDAAHPHVLGVPREGVVAHESRERAHLDLHREGRVGVRERLEATCREGAGECDSCSAASIASSTDNRPQVLELRQDSSGAPRTRGGRGPSGRPPSAARPRPVRHRARDEHAPAMSSRRREGARPQPPGGRDRRASTPACRPPGTCRGSG
ncbi:hypothetical protein AIF0345_2960 [Actinomyces israelii]|nr:hypothetical protein AIF0345_2960 [Actinomyces israelii]